MKYNPNRQKLFPAWARRATACAVALICLGALAHRAAAGGGTLDTTFGGWGAVTTDFGGEDKAYAVAIQPDGKIVVVGTTRSNNQTYDYKVVMARYNPDGSLDPGFGSGGKVIGASTSNEGFAVAVQTDGKILTAGFGPSDVTRFNGDGSPDTSFGNGGSTGKLLNPYTMLLQPDGKILVGGYLNLTYRNANFAVVRYNGDGTVDTGFGSGGRATTDFYTGRDEIHALALQPDGRIVAAGLASWGGSDDYSVLARYEANGTLDTSFGSGGKVTTDFSPNQGIKYHRFYALAVQPDGKILAAGATRHYDDWDSFAVARYNYDGGPDLNFGSSGRVTTKIFGNPSTGSALALQPDGRFFVAGCASGGYGCYNSGSFALAHYNQDGSLDAGFGFNNSGQLTTQVSGFGYDSASAIALQPDGKVVVVGSSQIPASTCCNYDFAVARYLPPSSKQQPPPPAPPTTGGGHGDTDPLPPPGDGDVGPGDEPSDLADDSFSSSEATSSSGEAFSPDVPAQSQDVVWQSPGSGSAVTFSPDGQTLLEGNRLRRASDGAVIRAFNIRTSGGQIDAVAFSPDGQYVAMGVASFNLNLSLFRVSDGARLAELTGSSNGTTTVKFSPDGQYLACGGRGGTVKLLHVPDMTLVKTFLGGVGYGARVFALLFSQDGQFLAVGGQGGAQIIRVSDGAVLQKLVDGSKTITSLALSPDGQTLATGFFTADQNKLYPVKFWRFSDGALLNTIEASNQGIEALAYQPDGQVIACGGGDWTYAGVVRFFRLSDSSQLGFFPQDPNNLFTYVTGVAYSPDGKLVAYARHDSFIVVTRNPFASRQPPPPPAPPTTDGGHTDTDPMPPPGDGDVGPGEEPPSAQ